MKGQNPYPALGKHFMKAFSLSMGNTYWNPAIKEMTSELMIVPDVPGLLKRRCERRHVLFPLGWKEQEWVILYRAVLLLLPKPVHLKLVWLPLPSSATDCPFRSSLNEQGNQSQGSQSRFSFHEVKRWSCWGQVGCIYFAILYSILLKKG